MQSNYNANISELDLASQNPYKQRQQQPGTSSDVRYGQRPTGPQQQQRLDALYDAPVQGNLNRFDSPYMAPADAPYDGGPGGVRGGRYDDPSVASPYARRATGSPPRGREPFLPQHHVHGQGPPHEPPLGRYDPPPPAPRTRSPSPTPTEIAEINRPLYDFSPMKSKHYWLQWRLVPWYILGIACIVGFAFLTLYHKQIVTALKPAADWAERLKFGWLIPIAVLFVISFPPLFGHEIVAVICGLVWGLGVGFAIVCAGTLIGEIGNYYAFKYCCRARAEKLEKEKPYYDCLARVVRDGGFKVALMARLSAIPGHFTTAIFATCGMNIWVFTLAAFLSLPKQFIVVYAGVVLDESAEAKDGSSEKKNGNTTTKIISNVVAVLSIVITFWALWYIYKKMIEVKPIVFRERRLARLAKLKAANAAAAEREGDFDTNATRVGQFDKYGGSMDPINANRSDEFEMRESKREQYEPRGRKGVDKERFAANMRAGKDDAYSVESDTPLSAPAMQVEYKPYIGVDDRMPYGHAQGATDQGYSSPGQQYGGAYETDIVARSAQRAPVPAPQFHQRTGKLQKRPPQQQQQQQQQRPAPASREVTPRSGAGGYTPPDPTPGRPESLHNSPYIATGYTPDPQPPAPPSESYHGAPSATDHSTESYASSQHVFQRPQQPPPGAGFAQPKVMVQQKYPSPPDQYRVRQTPGHEQGNTFGQEHSEWHVPRFASSPGGSPPSGPVDMGPSTSDRTVRGTSPPPSQGTYYHGPGTMAPAPSRATVPEPESVHVVDYGVAAGEPHRRKESSHTREATEYLGTGAHATGRRGAAHATEATAYYSASEGEDDDDRVARLPPKTDSRMPGQLYREESEPGWR